MILDTEDPYNAKKDSEAPFVYNPGANRPTGGRLEEDPGGP